VRTLSDGGSYDQPLKNELFRTISSLDFFNTKILSIRQPIIVATTMNVNPLMVVILVKVLHIQLPKYHDNDDHIIYIQQLTKVRTTNGKDTYDHKLQYFKILVEGELLINLLGMRQFIQQRHGMKYNVLLSINLVRFIVKDKQLQL